ncbi:MAG: hypothetical protein U0V49_00420 [Saprospiraceae bacterium]
MSNYDWSRFTVKQVVHAPDSQIHKLLSTPSGLETWFLRSAILKDPNGNVRLGHEAIQAMDRYVWQWHGYPDSVSEQGEFLTPEKDEIIRFKFGSAGIVHIRILHEHAETIIELQQTDIPIHEEAKVNWHLGCKTGWTFYLLNLKSVLEGGRDLRNKNQALNLD